MPGHHLVDFFEVPVLVARDEFPGGKRFRFVDPGGCELAVWTKVGE